LRTAIHLLLYLLILTMCVSAVVCEKSRGNKKCDDNEEGQNFGLFGIDLKWS